MRLEAGVRYHATAEEGIAFRRIAEAVGRSPGVPTVSISRDDAAGHFGWLSTFIDKDMSALSTRTRERLEWHPVGPGLLADLRYCQASAA